MKKRAFNKSFFFFFFPDPSVILKGGERIFFYVNQRPIHYVKSELKELVATIRNRYRESLGISEGILYFYSKKDRLLIKTYTTAVSAKKTPFIYIHIQLSPDEFDGIEIHNLYAYH